MNVSAHCRRSHKRIGGTIAALTLSLLVFLLVGCGSGVESHTVKGFRDYGITDVSVRVKNASDYDIPRVWLRSVENRFVAQLARRGYRTGVIGDVVDRQAERDNRADSLVVETPRSGRIGDSAAIADNRALLLVEVTEFDYDHGAGVDGRRLGDREGRDLAARCTVSARMIDRGDYGTVLWQATHRGGNNAWHNRKASDLLYLVSDAVAKKIPRP